MDNGRLRYLQHFLDCVDFVTSGRKGMISDDRILVSDYVPEYYDVIAPHLSSNSVAVRREVVMLMTRLKERRCADRIREMRANDCDTVSMACLAYMNSMEIGDSTVPELLEILRHRNGPEFSKAASKMRSVARKEDIDGLRTVYGQVDGQMRDAVREILETIIARNPELKPKEYLILSVPVYPDEEKFLKFVDKCIVFLDIEYREKVLERSSLSLESYNKVAGTLRKIQIRLYNEKPNLKYYEAEAKQGYSDAEELLVWAMDDLSSKRVLRSKEKSVAVSCPECGARMIRSDNVWICPDCRRKL